MDKIPLRLLSSPPSFSKSFVLSSFYLRNLYYISFKHERFFLLKKNYTFFAIPFFIKIKKNKDGFLFEFKNLFKFSNDLYCSKLLSWLRFSDKKIKQKLILKGLGFRSYMSEDKTRISFKIGFSHMISLKVPEKILSVAIEKNFIVFEAHDNIILGNFCKKIKKLRRLDVYKNKGFSSKNEIAYSKPIKKT